MNVRAALHGLRTRLAGPGPPLPDGLLAPLRGVALEIGGPSAVFEPSGRLPAYARFDRVDGCQFSSETVWHGSMREGAYAVAGPSQPGHLWVRDGADLDGVPDAAYDAVLSSHVIEHIANPLRALREWRRVLRPGGHVLIVIPHSEGTFDHRRPVTSLEHLVSDLERGTGEDDLTHLDEVLALHDHARDAFPGGPEAHAAMARDNLAHRVIHHHTFTTPSALRMLDRAGLQILAAAARRPHDIFVLARSPADGERVDNRAFLQAGAIESPFRRDRRA